MPHDVFISYSSKDKAVADAACATLEARRIRCWIAPRDILPGTEYADALVNAIEECRMLLLIFSGSANASGQVRREVERAVSKSKIILPFRIENALPSHAMEFHLGNTHWLDALSPPLEHHLQTLADVIERILKLVPLRDSSPDEIIPPPPDPASITNTALGILGVPLVPPIPPPQPHPHKDAEPPRPVPQPYPPLLALALAALGLLIIGLAGVTIWWVHKVAKSETDTFKVSTVSTPAATATPAPRMAATPPAATPHVDQWSAMRGQALGFYTGTSGKMDQALAAKLFQQASASGDPLSRMWLARLNDDGKGGLTKNITEATRLAGDVIGAVRQLATSGNPEAEALYARCQDAGLGVPQDRKEALRWCRMAAEAGDVVGMTDLGAMYYNGSGAPQDYTEAAKWYLKAAEAGGVMGMTYLASMYEGDSGIPQDYAEALRWYHKAADAGEVGAMTGLGTMYSHGYGVTQDYTEAVRWHRKAADTGDPWGMTNLGSMYETGRGVPQDYAEAISWYRKAADAGDGRGMAYLGAMYQTGHGVVEDDRVAASWYLNGANAGDATAMNDLGAMYEAGKGVDKDEAKAVQWYQKAAKLGSPESQASLKRLGKTW